MATEVHCSNFDDVSNQSITPAPPRRNMSWQDIQKKTFTKWANEHLKSRGSCRR